MHIYLNLKLSTVKRNFYVDDCLKSIPTEEGAVKLALDLQSLMKMGGYRLTKWLSNSRKVLCAIPESERAPSGVNLNPCDALPSDRALGINWNVNEDKIKFVVKVEDRPLTRPGILSTVSFIFDPLVDGWLRMGLLPHPLGNFADISYLVEN